MILQIIHHNREQRTAPAAQWQKFASSGNHNLSNVIMKPEMWLESSLGKNIKNARGGSWINGKLNWITFANLSESLHTYPENLPCTCPLTERQILNLSNVDAITWDTLILFSLLVPTVNSDGFSEQRRCLHAQASQMAMMEQSVLRCDPPERSQSSGGLSKAAIRSWARLFTVLMKMWVSSHFSSSGPHSQPRSLLNFSSSLHSNY